ncbi:MAG TPA: GFA family protein [Rhizomicrobium sp.]|nr:GFA family protein [Rhizomicrobium sp.]
MHTGSCLCGAVRFEVTGALAAADACHCDQCRRWSGHYWVSANVQRAALTLHGADRLAWYASSDRVRRGFCSACGSALFWDPAGHDFVAVALGAFDKPTGGHLEKHIFVSEKGDYYAIADGLPQKQRFE